MIMFHLHVFYHIFIFKHVTTLSSSTSNVLFLKCICCVIYRNISEVVEDYFLLLVSLKIDAHFSLATI